MLYFEFENELKFYNLRARLEPDLRSVGPDLDSTVCKAYQQMTSGQN